MSLVSQCLAGLALASPLFLLAAGLTLTFAVNRTIDVSQGALGMLGAYVAWSILTRLPHDPASLILGTLATASIIALLGGALETLLLRRLGHSLRLVATLGVLLIVQDAVALLWGPGTLAVPPIDDPTLLAIGPLAFAALLLLLHRTRWGSWIRKPEGDPRWRSASVASLAAGLAGLAGALTLERGAATPGLDLVLLTDAIVVALIGGLGSVTGAYLAALLIGLLHSFGAAFLPPSSPVLAAAVMAAILLVRPYGLFGRPHTEARAAPTLIRPTPLSVRLLFAAALLGAIAAPVLAGPDILSVLIEAFIAILFAASLHVVMGPGGMPSLGHAAFFGIGAYATAALARDTIPDLSLALLAAPLAAGTAALLVGALVIRRSGLYIALLTLVFAQTLWTLAVEIGAYQVIRPATGPLYGLTLVLCIGTTLLLRRALNSPFGYALRAIRDDPVRAAAIGLPTYLVRLSGFTLAGAAAGLAGGLSALSRGGASPADLSLATSAEAVLMVLLGGLQTLSGPVVGALATTAFRDTVLQATTAWRLWLGLALVATALLVPQGLAGASLRAWRRAA